MKPLTLFHLGVLAFVGMVAADSQGETVTGSAATKVRIVSAGAVVQSRKRGVCANHLSAADFHALAPGVSWFYNWFYRTDDVAPSDVAVGFIPMVWGDRPDDLAGIEKYLQEAPTAPRAILAINEPNLKGQAFIAPEATADLYAKVEAIAGNQHLPIVGPNMALGSDTSSSISAFDPVLGKQTTYTFMGPFLDAFLHYHGGRPVPALGLHSYGDLEELKWAVQFMHEKYGSVVWVTEFADWKADSVDDERKYLEEAVDFLERTPYVQGYAWFKERADNAKISLLSPTDGRLTELGETYVQMPVHDADIYRTVPGQLSAAEYTMFTQADIMARNHGSLLVVSSAAGAIARYQINLTQATDVNLTVKFMGPGRMRFREDGKEIGSITGASSDVQERSVPLSLPLGIQAIDVIFDAKNMILESLRFDQAHK